MIILKELIDKGIATPPQFVETSMHMLMKMGSTAYGTASKDSDTDLYGVCIPPKEILFPHLAGYIVGYDLEYPRFDHYQQQHLKLNNNEYDLNIYNIIKYFRLCADNNPNLIDSLFVPDDCILYLSPIGKLIRDNRRLFLSKKCWHTYKGYAYQQLHKMRTKGNNAGAKRHELFKKYGYNTKYAYHLVRLLMQAEQILEFGDMDLRGNSQLLREIKGGEWSVTQVEDFFNSRQGSLQGLYKSSNKIPDKPREKEIKELLIRILKSANVLD